MRGWEGEEGDEVHFDHADSLPPPPPPLIRTVNTFACNRRNCRSNISIINSTRGKGHEFSIDDGYGDGGGINNNNNTFCDPLVRHNPLIYSTPMN